MPYIVSLSRPPDPSSIDIEIIGIATGAGSAMATGATKESITAKMLAKIAVDRRVMHPP